MQKQIDFTVHADRVQHRCVWCDRRNLNRILLNVVSNAYKFTPKGGTVSVSVWEGGAGEDGYAATRAIRSLSDPKLSAVPILAMTANAFKEDEEASLQAGMQAHIAEPIDVKVLKKALSQALAKR